MAVLEQSLQKLGVERLSKYDVERMEIDVLVAKIENWIHYMRISVRKHTSKNHNIYMCIPYRL